MLLRIELIRFFLVLPGRMLLDGCLLWPASSGHLGYHLATMQDPRRLSGPSALGRRLESLHEGERS